MEKNVILGTIITGAALGFITYITFWSKKTIERIAKKNLGSVREILKDIQDG
ncbi:MAG: hypothetical protein ACMUIU_05055 [bacterium]